MASKKKKLYVVWNGTTPGVYRTWAECESRIKGFSNAKYKSFPALESAEKAFREGPENYWGIDTAVSLLLQLLPESETCVTRNEAVIVQHQSAEANPSVASDWCRASAAP